MKQTLKIGITVLVVASLAMSGVALAQTDESTDQAAQNAVTRIAEKLQSLVDDGTITADQADAVAEALADGVRPGGRDGRRDGKRGANFGAVAEFLGMEGDEFRQALQDYDTLADLAAANGSSGSELIAFMVGQAEDRLDQAVADGRITQAEADEKLAECTARITEKVNSEIPEAGRRGGRGQGEGMPGGFGGQPPAEGTALSA